MKKSMLAVYATAYCSLLSFQISVAQSDHGTGWWGRLNDPYADFNQIVADADSFFLNADSAALAHSPISPKHFGYWYNHWRHRLDENGSTRVDAFDLAYEVYTGGSQCNGSINDPNWEEVGPTVVALGNNGGKGVGFIDEAWIKPGNHNIMLIGAAGGGLWKTTNGGTTWVDLMPPTNGRIPYIAVQALEVNPDNENHIYASIGNTFTGDNYYGLGLLRSTDGGSTWQPTYLTNDPSVSYWWTWIGIPKKIVANKPQYFAHAYAITSSSLWKTTDGFQSATQLYYTFGQGEELVNLARNQSGNVFASAMSTTFNADDTNTWSQSPITLIRYNENTSTVTDITQNLNWTHQNTAGYVKLLICTAADRPNHVYVLQERVTTSKHHFLTFYSSSNNGQNFTTEFDQQIGGPRFEFAASLADQNTFYVSGPVLAHKITKNGGAWNYDQNFSTTSPSSSKYAHADVRDIDVLTVQGGEHVYWSTDGGLFRSEGSTFTNVTEQDLSLWMVNGFVDFDATGEIFCGVYHGGNNRRDSNGVWRIMGGADGGKWGVADGNSEQLIAGSNSGIERYNRTNLVSWGPGVSSNGWWKYVAFPVETYWNTEDSFLVAGDDLLIYDWSQNQIADTLTTGLTTREIRDVKCHRANSDIIVFANNRYISYDSALYRSTNGGQTWTDISPNLNLEHCINTIFIHPANANEIWIGLSGYGQDGKVFVTNNGGSTWQDASAGLGVNTTFSGTLIMPVNDFAYDAIADVLYVATDYGVYYYDKAEENEQWHCYYKNLPTAFVNEIDVNYCTKKLVAATAGRGFHEVILHNSHKHNAPPAETWTNTTLGPNSEHYSPVSITVSGTVTIEGTLRMNEDAVINVPPGAHLIVDGGTITNACGGLWGGIRAWGDYHGSTAGKRPFPQSDLNKHGRVTIKNNALIEQAHTGVKLGGEDLGSYYKGGILHASNSEFRNNYRSVQFLSYHHHQPLPPYKEVNNMSSIQNCTFVTDAALDDDQITEPNAQIHMHDVKGIHIKGCTFNDEIPWGDPLRSGNSNRRIGIKAYDATFSVDPICTGQSAFYVTSGCWNQQNANKNTFSGYKEAISCENWNSPLPVTVRGAEFTDNGTGVALWGTDLAEIYKNEFTNTSNSATGLYMVGNTGYFVEDNDFTKTSGTSVGLLTATSGPDANLIRNNRFENLYNANWALFQNDGPAEFDGLQYRCNEMVNSGYRDISVIDGDIAKYQGLCVFAYPEDNPIPFEPADNTFTSPCSGVKNFAINAPSQTIYYAHRLGEGPVCYSSSFISLLPCGETEHPRCLPSAKSNPSGHTKADDLIGFASVFLGDVDDNAGEINNLIATDAPASTVVNALMGASPLLKDETLVMAVSEKPTPLSDNDLLQVLYSVAPLSEAVYNALQTRSPGLCDSVDNYVTENGITVSPTELAWAPYWQALNGAKYHHEEILRYHMVYDSTGAGYGNALTFLRANEGEQFRKKEFQLLLRMGDLPTASTLLADIENTYNTDSHLDGFVEWGDIALALATDSAGVFALKTDSVLETRVRALADTNLTAIENYDARALLSLVFDEPQNMLSITDYMDDPMHKRDGDARPFDDFEETNAEMLALYPNPASEVVTIAFQLPDKVEQGVVRVYTADGKQVFSTNVTAADKQVGMDVSRLKDGVYIYLLTAEGGFVARRKLIVAK